MLWYPYMDGREDAWELIGHLERLPSAQPYPLGLIERAGCSDHYYYLTSDAGSWEDPVTGEPLTRDEAHDALEAYLGRVRDCIRDVLTGAGRP